MYTIIYKVYTDALYIIPFCLHLVSCCRGKFTSTANRSNAYVYDTVMCQWCLWLWCHVYKAPLRVCGGRDNEISTTNFYVVPPLLTHLRCKNFGGGIWSYKYKETRHLRDCGYLDTLEPANNTCLLFSLFIFWSYSWNTVPHKGR